MGLGQALMDASQKALGGVMVGSQLNTTANAGASANNTTPATNYGGTGNPLNELLYSKQQYDNGNQAWAANNANQYYNKLSPDVANQVHAMNSQQLSDYINKQNAPQVQAKDTTTPVTTTTTGGNTGGNTSGQSSGTNNDSLIKSIYDSMYASQSQQAKALRDQQLAGLAGQDTLAQNNAQSGLNANDASGARLAQQLREHMANLGLGQSGDYISAQVGQNTAQGQNANQINMDLATKLQQLAAQKDAINNNASANDLALLQQIQAEQGKAQLSDRNTQQQFGLQQAGLTGQYNGAPTLAAQGQQAQYTGQYGDQPTLQAQAQAYAQNPNNPTNIGLGLNNQLTQLKLNDYPAQSQAAAQQVQQQLQAGQITNQEAQLKLDQLKDPNSLANQQLKAQLDLTNSQSSYYKDHGQYYAGGGSQSGTANKTATTNSYTGSVYDQLSQLDPSDYKGYLEANQAEIVKNIGQKAYDDFKKSVLADQTAQGKADTTQGKVDLTIREKAIAAAQKDPNFLSGSAKLKDLIPQYEELYK